MGVIVLILLFTGIFADVLAPYEGNEIHMVDRMAGVSPKYLLGSDQLGRDILSRLIHGAPGFSNRWPRGEYHRNSGRRNNRRPFGIFWQLV